MAREIDFLHVFNRQTPRQRPWGAYIIRGFILLAFLFVFLASISAHRAFQATRSALAGREALTESVTRITLRQWDGALFAARTGQTHIEEAQAHLRWLRPWRAVPLIRRQIVATEDILIAVGGLASALQDGAILARDMTATVFGDKSLSFDDITVAERQRFLAQLDNAAPTLRAIAARVDEATTVVERIPTTLLIPQIARVVAPLREDLVRADDALAVAIPFLEALPLVVGYPEPQTYLFLFQNNDELRPTGGFIGTYGRLVLENGEIVSLQTDNIYRIDKLAERNGLRVPPPAPIADLLKTDRWFLRDANWSPDFPTTAERAMWFYRQETGDRRPIDGVIAVTPTVLESLLSVLGPLTVQGERFVSETVVDQLQYHVEKRYAEIGLPEIERKSIIGDLARAIVGTTFALPLDRAPELMNVFSNAIDEKHVLFYQANPILQKLIKREGWSGEIVPTEGDTLMVVDANYRALKTDQVMERAIDYAVWPERDGLHARAHITYKNTGVETWKTTHYRTYTRVYVPRGARLKSADGFLETTSPYPPTGPDIYDEHGRTVFAGFVYVPVGTTRTLTLEYVLPRRVADADYSLIIQKQPGTLAHELTVDLRFGTKIEGFSPSGDGVSTKRRQYVYEGDLRVDRAFTIEF